MKSILMLDDDTARINRYFATIGAHSRDITLTVQRTPQAFIAAYLARPTQIELICLHRSHLSQSTDPLEVCDGCDVSRFLADCDAACPVLIHSSDNSGAAKMLNMLLAAGWIAIRFRTLGSDWIETHWFPYVRKILGV